MTDIAAGRQSLAAGRWEEALEHFRGGDDDPEALEGMGLAYWWLDDAEATLASRERAFRLYRDAGDSLGAARITSALASDSLLFGGRAAVAQGWLARGARARPGGRGRPGHARLDETAVAATAGEVDDLMWISQVCCNLIAACERVGDVEWATQWCDEVKELAQCVELRTLFNVCPHAVRVGAAPAGDVGRGRA
jgi:hypothetical protein